ncbi:uncharacterized protein LOC129594342 isoform X2 [Paramacrobiotus metropolitanus]|uniref:uncharacterized protein LOC129594342 isoform X2 n=1 Tax=Paramacrobiotus metropolitanus TaxID=2943436 RepID=UPI002446304B|nr:uncharacterized protein LOC129594342 isoform X2 [Paramacrobiotus metropolitanus]
MKPQRRNVRIFGAIKNAQSADILLLGLAVADLLTLWIFFPIYLFLISPAIFDSSYTFDYVNDYVQGLYIWLQSGFPKFADWVLVVFSVERLRAVVTPLSPAISVRVTRILVVTCLLYGIVTCIDKAIAQYYLLTTLDIPSFDAETSLPFQSSLPGYMQAWNTTSTFYGVVEEFVVFIILLICNMAIIYKVISHRRKSVRLHAQLAIKAKPGVTSAPHRIKKQTREAPLLISAVSTYLICKLPQAVNDTLGRLSRYPFCFVNYQNYNVLWRPADSIMLIPYSVNFYLYCAFSTKFRKDLKATYTALLVKTKLWKRAPPRNQEADAASSSNSDNWVSTVNTPQLNPRRLVIPVADTFHGNSERSQELDKLGDEANSCSSLATTSTVTTKL